MDEAYTIEPKSPKKPYAYIAHSIESCWERDEGVDENDDDLTTGNTRRCTSSYGPNAGKFKPGVVQEDLGGIFRLDCPSCSG